MKQNMPAQRFGSVYVVVLLCAVLVSCAPVGPDFVKPEAEPAGEWTQALGQGLEPVPAADPEWWKLFEDPVLNRFVETGRQRNNNLQIAGLRVLEARAQLGIAIGVQYPQSQFAAGQATYVSPPDNALINESGWQYGLAANASWEIDFWGRFRRGIEAADAAYLASIAAYEQAELLLISAIVEAYNGVRTVEEQLEISRQNLVLQKRSYDITEVLYKAGSDSELDMQQARTLYLATESSIPALEAVLVQARNALSTLLGLPPGTVTRELAESNGILKVPKQVSIGAPADLLRNRPDVREAEFIAMAQNALVGLAEADLYPSFSLTGSIGLSAGGPGDSDFGDLFSADALTFSVGPSFVWPFLNYGRIKNNVRVQDAVLQQALVNYRETVLQAAREAEDAIAGFIGASKQTRIQAETIAAAMRSNELSTLQYREGFAGYQRVLDSQQALFRQQQRYVEAQSQTVSSLISLQKALGSGWQGDAGRSRVSEGDIESMRKRTDWGELLDEERPRQDEDGAMRPVDW